jgi:hypothetical protein
VTAAQVLALFLPFEAVFLVLTGFLVAFGMADRIVRWFRTATDV